MIHILHYEGVNFKIKDSKSEVKIVHHDRHSAVVDNELDISCTQPQVLVPYIVTTNISDFDESSACENDDDSEISSCTDEDINPDNHEDLEPVNRPTRQRRMRQLPNTIPWHA